MKFVVAELKWPLPSSAWPKRHFSVSYSKGDGMLSISKMPGALNAAIILPRRKGLQVGRDNPGLFCLWLVELGSESESSHLHVQSLISLTGQLGRNHDESKNTLD